MSDIDQMTDAEFDEVYGGRELLPIEQVAYEAEGAERFARFHGHGKRFPKQVEVVDLAAKRHTNMTLRAFDDLNHASTREREDSRAEIERKARNTL